MILRKFDTNDSYVQYIHALHKLHQLGLAGEEDGTLADEIRDQMDLFWQHLSEIEIERIRGLSADLYSIEEPPIEPKQSNPQFQKNFNECNEERHRGNWDKALSLLRRWSEYITPAWLSYLRGSIWRAAGDYKTAELFYKHASKVEPTNINFTLVHFDTLLNSDPNAAFAFSEKILDDDANYPPALVMRAMEIKLSSLRNIDDHPTVEIRKHLTNIIGPTIERLHKPQNQEYSASFEQALCLAGICYEYLKIQDKALEYYDLLLEMNPKNDALLIARGMSQYRRSDSAVEDFKLAVYLRSQIPWPYIYLAHHCLCNNQFEECLKFCAKALDLAFDEKLSDTVLANIYEWIAIARSELQYPPQMVSDYFEKAVKFSPCNLRIINNYSIFKKSLIQNNASIIKWEFIAEADIKDIYSREHQLRLAT